jgi:hypothetical protein
MKRGAMVTRPSAQTLIVILLIVFFVVGTTWMQVIFSHLRNLEHSIVHTQKALEKLSGVPQRGRSGTHIWTNPLWSENREPTVKHVPEQEPLIKEVPIIKEVIKYITVPGPPAIVYREGVNTTAPPNGLFPFIPIQPMLKSAFERYKRLHADMLAGKIPARVLLYKPGGQLCNILRGTIAALLFALLTDRALLLENSHAWYNNYYDIFEKPGFDIQYDRAVHHKLVAQPTSGLSLDRDWEQLLCGNLTEAFDAPLVRVTAARYFSPFIYRNPLYQKVGTCKPTLINDKYNKIKSNN